MEKTAITFGATRELLTTLAKKKIKVIHEALPEGEFQGNVLGHPSTLKRALNRVTGKSDLTKAVDDLVGEGQHAIFVNKGNSTVPPRSVLFHEAGHLLGPNIAMESWPKAISKGLVQSLFEKNRNIPRKIIARKVLAEKAANETAVKMMPKDVVPVYRKNVEPGMHTYKALYTNEKI